MCNSGIAFKVVCGWRFHGLLRKILHINARSVRKPKNISNEIYNRNEHQDDLTMPSDISALTRQHNTMMIWH